MLFYNALFRFKDVKVYSVAINIIKPVLYIIENSSRILYHESLSLV